MSTSNRPMQDAVAWVVGGAGSLGQTIAGALAEAGARVVVSSRSVEGRWPVRSADGTWSRGAIALDLASGGQVDAAAREIEDRCGRIDLLVNCSAAPVFGDFLELDDEDWDTVLQAKLLGYMRTMRAVLPGMAGRGAGAIVNISGRGGRQPTPAHLPGCCANAAVNVLTKGVADIYGPRGVRINAIAPGPIDTPRHQEIVQGNALVGSAASKKLPPVGRLGEPRDVADAVLFLASPAAAFITGITLPVDGGGTATV
ncbi:SDR family NAD(P)-dependent oxidoreductase [Pigmentiphaga kullae]|uniref:3-oxoacyl-[acyl-carrier protein] reductase n=1 Tax=Pigmentiphaga kullae TaxID=151784 RepID=A0A4Q7N7S7_9BURK|nr:SDR family oxidoreductase [Pigmentiphaga kullae]RZS78049.1 3-oxoacyl-[acyl-carrier protein] reductase [Pigmentiphaga kullae]